MKVHEYQAKQIFDQAGIPVPPGDVATSPTEAFEIAERLNKPVMVKAQVHVGGRGKAGGVKYAENAEAAKVLAHKILGMDIKGLTVKKVLVTEAVEIISEAYVGIILDRATQKPVIMVSTEGGMEIEEVAAKSPEKIVTQAIDPVMGVMPWEARRLAFALGLKGDALKSGIKFINALWQAYMKEDCSMAEINPLVLTKQDQVIALDCKMEFEDNAEFRHPEHEELNDESENRAIKAVIESKREAKNCFRTYRVKIFICLFWL